MSRFRERRKIHKKVSEGDHRLKIIKMIVFLFAGIIGLRLFSLQVINNDFYSALAAGQHEIYKAIFPERGRILMKEVGGNNNSGDEKLYPLATNQSLYLVYADPRKIEGAEGLAEKLVDILYMRNKKEGEKLTVEEIEVIEKSEKERLKEEFLTKLKKENDPYEPLSRGVTEATLEKIKELQARGIGYIEEEARYYPEKSLASHLLGFVGVKDDKKIGQYGLEGYFEEELGGVQGFLSSEKDVAGRWIPISGREWQKAEDGADIVITIDRNIEYFACGKLEEAVKRHDADGGTVVIMDPKTGAILAMCSYPNFNPNEYAKVEDINIFNNPAIFYQYEPGSIFKAITIAAALDTGKIAPTTTYVDEGEIKVDDRTIKNSDLKAYGTQTMTQVLENSLNTGSVFAVSQIGPEIFKKYVEDFGFGEKTGVELDFENAGNINSLSKRGKIWSATGSFGQGISVTPIQIVAAFSAIANGGKLVKPYIVDRIIKSDGEVIKTEPKVIHQAISGRTSTLLGGMLVSVIENGHGKKAGVQGYYVAGKTGTAQVAKKDGSGYEKDVTIGSFVGFAPVEDPKFVMLTKIDHPRSTIWAEATAAPLFGEIAKFMLNYLKVPPSR